MEMKTKVLANDGEQHLLISRVFDLPLELLFKAYAEPDLVSQWMGTVVKKMDNRVHGSFEFETTDPKGNKMRFHGTIHTWVPDRQIVRTFEFVGMPFGVQLEQLDFSALPDGRSSLRIQSVFQSVAQRDQQLKLPFAFGLSMAHNRLEQILQPK